MERKNSILIAKHFKIPDHYDFSKVSRSQKINNLIIQKYQKFPQSEQEKYEKIGTHKDIAEISSEIDRLIHEKDRPIYDATVLIKIYEGTQTIKKNLSGEYACQRRNDLQKNVLKPSMLERIEIDQNVIQVKYQKPQAEGSDIPAIISDFVFSYLLFAYIDQ